jgi:NADPH:quinone reductase-like Zn-dependent oxidoreductase
MNPAQPPPRRWYRRKRTWLAGLVLALLAAGAMLWFCEPAPLPEPRGSGEPMRAVRYHEFGPPAVLRVEQVERPLPNDDQVLVQVRAAAANPLDWHYLRGIPYVARIEFGLRRPKDPKLGVDLSGVVTAVGRNVTQYKPGDAVFGSAAGAFAEYALVSPKRIAAKPAGISFEEAAGVPVAALTALQALRDKGRVGPGSKVLINGASGGVGTFAVQIAKLYGAEVTGVCSTRNVALVRTLGADHVVDYTQQDFAEGPQRYDVVMDNVGTRALLDFRRVMTPDGIYVQIGGGGVQDGNWLGGMTGPIKALLLAPFVSQQFGMMISKGSSDDLQLLAQWLEQGKIRTVIDRTYPFEDTAQALEYLETGRARGKVIVVVGREETPQQTSPGAPASDAPAPQPEKG